MLTTPSGTTDSRLPAVRDFDDLRELYQRANHGDATVLPQVRELIRRHPEAAIPALRGDVQAANRRVLIHRLSGGNRVRSEIVSRHLERLKEQLAGGQVATAGMFALEASSAGGTGRQATTAGPSPIEMILIDRILICWLQVQLGDRECFDAAHAAGKRAEHLEKVRDRAHRRFLSAVKMLATVRKLALPALQVNIADKQLNVSG